MTETGAIAGKNKKQENTITTPLPEAGRLDPAGDDPRLKVAAAQPEWFIQALATPCRSAVVESDGCNIHYLSWPAAEGAKKAGLLFVHGGGAHANWWRFIAPFFSHDRPVAAIDLSGMGDSGRRQKYSSARRANEMRAVIADAGLAANGRPFVVGHSFGGYMTMKFGREYGREIAGAIVVDSPIRPPDLEAARKRRRFSGKKRPYPDFEEAVGRFRLIPPQDCANDFIVEHIARTSLMPLEGGWSWKFDEEALGADRFDEPFAEHFANMACRRAFIHGADSALITPDILAHMLELLGPATPVIEIPGAQHHVMLDQPLAFVAAVRAVLAGWEAADNAG